MNSKLFTIYLKRDMLSLIIIAFVLSALVVSGCSSATAQDNVIRGSGKVVSEERPVGDFNSVSFTGPGKVIVTQADKESLTVEAEDNVMQYIKAEVKDGTLILGLTDEAMRKGFQFTKPIRFYLNIEEVVGLENAGPGDIQVLSLHANQLEIVVDWGGNVSVESLTAEELVVRLAGRASVEVAGQVGAQQVTLEGGAYRAAKLESQAAIVQVRNIGQATIWVTDSLDVQISGGSVEYYGSPHVIQNVTGRGKLSHLGES